MEVSGSWPIAVFLVFVIFYSGSVAAGSDEVEPIVYKCSNGSAKTVQLCLKNHLLKDYDTSLRPVQHQSNQTTVHMALFPLRIMVSSRWTSIACWIQKRWVDELLKWDPREFKNIQQLPLKLSSIWTPDINPLPIKGAESGWGSTSAATVVPSGTVSTVESMSYYIYCDLNTLRWPYETNECMLTLESEAYKGPELNVLMMDHKTPELKYFIQANDWKLVSMSSARISSETFDSKYFVVNLEYKFSMKREAPMLAAIAVFPAVVFAVVQLALFCLDKESSVRLILCSISVAVSWFVLIYVTKSIPTAGSSMPMIVTFYKYSLLISAFTFIWVVAVRSVCNLVTSPYWLYVATSKVNNNRYLSHLLPGNGNLRNASNLGTEDASALVGQAEDDNRQWRNMAEFADRVLFITCILLYLFLYLAYIPS